MSARNRYAPWYRTTADHGRRCAETIETVVDNRVRLEQARDQVDAGVRRPVIP